MTIVLLTLAFFLATLIVVTMLLEAAVMAIGRKDRNDARRRNHVH